MKNEIIKMYSEGYTSLEIMRDLDVDIDNVASLILNNTQLKQEHEENLSQRCKDYILQGYTENAISKILMLPLNSVKKLLNM